MDQPSGAQPTPTTLYRLYGHEGALLYIGITGDPGRRFEEHRGDKSWWGDVAVIKFEHHSTRMEALSLEAAAILAEDPPYNRHFSATAKAARGSSRSQELLQDGRRAVGAAAELGVSQAQYVQRRYSGWSIERAATTPLRPAVYADIKPGDAWGEWTVVSRKGSELVLRHGCGNERHARTFELSRIRNCPPCWRKGQGQKTPEEHEAARNARSEARHQEHPLGATRNGWTIVAHLGVQGRGLRIRARHVCGAELTTTAERITNKPPLCSCGDTSPG